MDKKNDMIVRGLNGVIEALNNIEVKGKNNLGNLAGCISILEQVRGAYVADCDKSKADSEETDEE